MRQSHTQSCKCYICMHLHRGHNIKITKAVLRNPFHSQCFIIHLIANLKRKTKGRLSPEIRTIGDRWIKNWPNEVPSFVFLQLVFICTACVVVVVDIQVLMSVDLSIGNNYHRLFTVDNASFVVGIHTFEPVIWLCCAFLFESWNRDRKWLQL